MIPAAVMMKLATLGLTVEHAEAVALMLSSVEQATREETGAAIETRRAADRERKQRQRHGKSRDVTGQDVTSGTTPSLKRKVSPCTPSKEKQPTPNTSEADASSVSRPADEIQPAFDAWNEMAAEAGLPEAKALTTTRRSHLKARLAEVGGLAGWIAALQRLAASSFCTGRKTDFRADIDFVLQPKSFSRLIEGSYDDRPTPKTSGGKPNGYRNREDDLHEAFADIRASRGVREPAVPSEQDRSWDGDKLASRQLTYERGTGGGDVSGQWRPAIVAGRGF